VVRGKKIFKWPCPIFALLWLYSLWRGLGLHLNKLEFQSCKKCLYQVWLKLARCFILKDSFQYTNIKTVSPLLSPTSILGDSNLYKLKSALSQKAFMQIWVILAQWFSRKNFFNDLTLFLHFCDYLPFEKDLGPLLVQFKIPITQGWFAPSFIEIDVLVLEKIFFNINICKYGFPYCGPSWHLETMMWTILDLHYIRKLSCKYELFSLSGSGAEDFEMTPPHFCD
jgi:hypothetical protein